MTIAIIGTGFVGVTTAAVYAEHGHTVYGVDIDERKVESLKTGVVPFFEPGLEDLLKKGVEAGNLHFTTSYTVAVPTADIIMVAVGTPSQVDGAINDAYVIAACESVAPLLKTGAIVIIKSTVPPNLIPKFEQIIRAKTQTEFYLATMPEFLKEGTAVEDTLHPDRVVIGTTNPGVADKLKELNQVFNVPMLVVSPQSAQMIKYASNSYLAQRITFINQIANVCEKVGADIQEVIKGIGFDHRIGDHYWYPGLGYGGSCFPKDVRELAHMADSLEINDNLFSWMRTANAHRVDEVLREFSSQVDGWDGKTVAILGLAFKPQTDDTRDAPAQFIIPQLIRAGATVRGYDPKARFMMTADLSTSADRYTPTSSIAEAVKNADVIMSVIEWPEIINFDFGPHKAQDKQQWFIDIRNQFDPARVRGWGYKYSGIGRNNV